jgi:hypothetical protein
LKDSSILSIGSKDEMEFITKNIGSRSILYEVWIGLERDSTTGKRNS